MGTIDNAMSYGKQQKGLRMADGGQAPTPSLGSRVVSFLMPKTTTRLGLRGAAIDNAVNGAPAPAPAPVAAPEEPPKPFRFANGGLVRGPGTSTSDSVPAWYSKNEYVLPADTTAAIGVDNLDAIKDATHTPVNSGRRAGMPHLADGGAPIRSIGDAYDAISDRAVNGAPGLQPGETPTPPSPIANGLRAYGDTVGGAYKGMVGSVGLHAGAAVDAGRKLIADASGVKLDNPTSDFTNASAKMVYDSSQTVPAGLRQGVANVIGGTVLPSASAATLPASASAATPTSTGAGNTNTKYPEMDDNQRYLLDSGVPLDAQNAPVTSLRDGMGNINTVDGGDAVNLGLRGGNTNIYGTSSNMDGGKIDTFSGSGLGKSSGYENSDRYKEGVARAAKDKQTLANLVADREAADKKDEITRLQNGLRTAPPEQRKSLRNQLAEANLSKREDTKLAVEAGLRGREYMLNAQKFAIEQQNKNREFSNKDREFSRESGQDALKNKQEAENQLQKNLEASNMAAGPDGKPTFDANTVAYQRQGINRAMARMGAAGPQDLSQMDQQRLVAGSHLMALVQKDATNWPIPWKPDFLTTMDPSDLIGMKRLPNGDAQLRNGNVIPGRYISKEAGDHIGGVPTNRYDILFGK